MPFLCLTTQVLKCSLVRSGLEHNGWSFLLKLGRGLSGLNVTSGRKNCARLHLCMVSWRLSYLTNHPKLARPDSHAADDLQACAHYVLKL